MWHSVYLGRNVSMPTGGTGTCGKIRSGWTINALVFIVAVIMQQSHSVQAVIQTLEMEITIGRDAPYKVLASQAFYGPMPDVVPAHNPRWTVITGAQPAGMANTDGLDRFWCGNDITATERTPVLPADSIVLIPQGRCTFQQKTWTAQQFGARAVIIYGNLEGRYSLNQTNTTDSDKTMDDIVYPLEYHDYDCAKGQTWIPSYVLSFDPLPYNAERNDFQLMGAHSLCAQMASGSFLSKCTSQACLLTGNTSQFQDQPVMQACCAWDLPIFLSRDPIMANTTPPVNIPSAYLTMAQIRPLLDRGNETITIRMNARWRPDINISSFLIWALGVTVAALAAHLTASDYRRFTRKVQRAQQRRQQQPSQQQGGDGENRNSQQQSAVQRQPDEALELTAVHALVFIVMASTTLLVLFYFKIYGVVKVMYALGCSNAASQVLFSPLLKVIMRKMKFRDRIFWRTNTEDFGDISLGDALAFTAGFSLGISWLVVSFVIRDPERLPFFWITQNIFGACMCIMFLKVIRLNSIHVASILLIVAFFYDIFFVFITPLLFRGKSIMITVATSGGPPKADELWCEKYPDDVNCQGGNPLPMLLTFPRILDYEGGSSLLGLGDIVLPGLLMSFAARLDAAKSLLGVMGGGSGSISIHCPEERYFGPCRFCSGGYFIPLVISYAVGLGMANSAVYLMEMGQPALLYLVPCCLGTLCFIGWRRNDLRELWNGPKALRAADALIYGEHPPAVSPLPVEENGVLTAVPHSAIDDDSDDADLFDAEVTPEHG